MNASGHSSIVKTFKETAPEALLGIITPLMATNPVLAVSLAVVGSMYGAVLLYKQNAFNEQIQSILDNPEIFTHEIINTKEFTDGLVVHFDSYFKMRGDLKLKKARDIFLDFAICKNKPIYPLERYDDVLLKISDAGIRLLGFIENKVPSLKKNHLEERAAQNGADLSDEKVRKQYQEGYVNNKPLSYFIDIIYINDYVRQKVKSNSNNYLFEKDNLNKKLLQELYLVVNELTQLGLLEKGVSMKPQGWDGVGETQSYYNLTHFGRMFTSIIKPEAEDTPFEESPIS